MTSKFIVLQVWSVFLVCMLSGTAFSSNPAGSLPSVDLFTGGLNYSVPIKVPSERNGVQPSVSLGYRSSKETGLIGLGWELELGSIERNSKNGIDPNGDDFIYRGGGGGRVSLSMSE